MLTDCIDKMPTQNKFIICGRERPIAFMQFSMYCLTNAALLHTFQHVNSGQGEYDEHILHVCGPLLDKIEGT